MQESSRDQGLKVGRRLLHGFGLLVQATLAVLLVACAAILISIIQFQIRVIEAKTQSRNFSLTSLVQSVQMQKELEKSLATVQVAAPLFSSYEEFQIFYSSQVVRVASQICLAPKKEFQIDCTIRIGGALTSGLTTPTHLHGMLRRFDTDPEKLDDEFKTAIADAGQIARERDEFAKKNKDNLGKVRSACLVLLTFSAPVAAEAADRGSIMNTFSSEYVRSARMRCMSHYGLGTGSPTPELAVATIGAPLSGLGTTAGQSAGQQMGGAGAAPASASAPKIAIPEKRELESDIAWALFYDLVAYYRFYEKFFDANTELIVIAPIDISFVLLVIICGALGAMLRVTAEIYNPKLFGKEPGAKRISPVYYFILGIMCSLIIYILAKTALAGIAESSYGSKSGSLSPFVTAFLAVISGAICEEAFQVILRAGRSMLNRVGNQEAIAKRPSKPPAKPAESKT